MRFCRSIALVLAIALALPVHAEPKGQAQSTGTASEHGKNGPAAKPEIVFPTADIQRIASALEAANGKQQSAAEQKYSSDYLHTQKDMVT